MSRIVRMATLLTLLGCPAWAGGLGISWSTWDTSDAGDDQGLGVRFELDVGERIDLELRGAWLDSLGLTAQGRVFKLEAMPVDIGVSYDFAGGEKVQPFAGAGLSFVFLNGKEAAGGALQVDDEFGYYVVAGLEAGIHERFGVFAEVLYREVSANFTGDGFLRDIGDFAVDVGGVGGNIGVKLGW